MSEPCTNDDLDKRINKLEVESASIDISLKKSIDALEKQMNLQFIGAKTAVDAALAAQKELVNTSFASSEKAIQKAETAQTQYNERSNEFRAALDDSNRLNISRIEVGGMFKSFEDKMGVDKQANEKAFDNIKDDIKSLRESRSVNFGKDTGAQLQDTRFQNMWGFVIGLMGVIIAAITLIIKFH